MTRDEFIIWAERHGFRKDRYGHLVRDLSSTGGDVRRLKMSKSKVRFEIRAEIGGRNEWIRLRSGYFSKMSLPNGVNGKIMLDE